MDKIKEILAGLMVLIILGGCSVKKQAFNYVEIIKDSTHSKVDTFYRSKEVSFEIESEDDFESSYLKFSPDEFNRYIDSLFAEIDTACDKEQLVETIIKTKGLWSCDTSYLQTSLASSHAVVKNGQLFHFLHQKDTTIIRRYDSLLQVIEKEREIWHNRQVHESSEKITRSGWNFKFIAIIIIVLLIAWIILRKFL